MSLTKELADWRETLTNDRERDKEPPPTEEAILGQFVFSVVVDLLDNQWQEIIDYLGGTDDDPKFLDAWIDRKADA